MRENSRQHPQKPPMAWMIFVVAVLLSSGMVQHAAAQKEADGRMMLQMAQQLEMGGRLDQAAELYARVARSREYQKDLRPYLSAKRCWQQLKTLDAWKALILELQTHHRDLQFETDLAEIEYLAGETNSAIKRWRDVAVNNPVNERAYLLVGTAFLEYQLYSDAQWLYERGRKSFKDADKFFFELVRVYQAQGEYHKMCQEYVTFLRKNPNQLGFVQGQLLALTSDEAVFNPVVRALEEYLKNDKTFTAAGHRILAALHTQKRQYREALDHYAALERQLIEQSKTEFGQYYITFATVAMNDGAYAEAREALERILTQKETGHPMRTRAAFAKAQILEKEKKYDLAIAAYESFIADYPQWPEMLEVLTRLATLYFDITFAIDKAESTYLRILKQQPLPLNFRLMAEQKLAECQIARGAWEAAQHHLSRLKQDAPATSPYRQQADLMLAELDFYRGHAHAAMEKLGRQINASDKKNSAAVDTVQNNILELYFFLRENQQDSAGLAVIGSVKWLQKQRQYAAAYDTLYLLAQRRKNTPLHEEASFLQIALLRQMSRYEEALSVCQSLVQEPFLGRADLALLTLAEVYEDMADSYQAQQIYESFLEKYPQSIYIEQVRVRVRKLDKRLL